MSMEDLWLRQSVHGWVLFLVIKVLTKVKEITEASASVGLLLATAVEICLITKKPTIKTMARKNVSF